MLNNYLLCIMIKDKNLDFSHKKNFDNRLSNFRLPLKYTTIQSENIT